MVRNLHLILAAFCITSYAMAATPSIGTVTARGELRIDSYAVQGSGTVFDGSAVETGETAQSVADVRLQDGSVITLYGDSGGTVHRDRFELQRGKIEFASSGSFRVEANGLIVSPSGTRVSGLVSIDAGSTVNVVAQTGDFEVRGNNGTVVAEVHPGRPLAFSALNGQPSTTFSAEGVISAESGHYYLQTAGTDVKYELRGNNVENFAGSQVTATGTVDPAVAHDGGSAAVVNADSIVNVALTDHSAETRAIIGGLSIKSTVTPDTVTVCGSTVNPYPCCPRGTTAEHCCPGNDASPMCCSNLLYPSSECHHSY
jgi:hypothetical protein